MSKENAKKILEQLSTNEGLKSDMKELCKLTDKEEIKESFKVIAKKYGCECDLRTFVEMQKESVKELSIEELAKVDAAGWGACLIFGLGETGAEEGQGAGACFGVGIGVGLWDWD